MLHFEDTFTVWNAYDTTSVIKLGKTANNKDYGEIAITSSSKNKTTGKYITDYKGIVRLYGSALEKAKGLGLVERDRVKMKGTIININEQGKASKYPNITCWEIEKVDKPAVEVPKAPTVVEDLQPLDDLDTGDLPF